MSRIRQQYDDEFRKNAVKLRQCYFEDGQGPMRGPWNQSKPTLALEENIH